MFQDGDGWYKINSRDDVIDWIVENFDPIQFENFCISILSLHCNVPIQITQKNPITGADGGFDGEGSYMIDGELHPIALQAKRYAPFRQVGYDHCERFVGGLIRRQWKHGFMITTSTFSEKAQECVYDFSKQGIFIELIDQNRLIDIMLTKTTDPHGFGLHQTDYGLIYMNETILKNAGSMN